MRHYCLIILLCCASMELFAQQNFHGFMIHKIQTTYATRLEEYLSRFHNRPEGLAMVGQIWNGIYTRILVDSD